MVKVISTMDENGGNKVSGTRQVAKWREFLQKWQQSKSGEVCSGISPEISWRLKNSNVQCDSDEESCQSLDMPSDVPRGFLAVYVGPEHRRFIIPTSYLSDPLFKVLLEKVEEEFGFDHTGGLTIPCDTETFKYLLKCMENHKKQGETSLPEEEIRAD